MGQYRVVYGEREKTFATKREAEAFAKDHRSLSDIIFTIYRVVPGEVLRLSPGAPLVERLAFHSMPEPNSGCWLWLSAVDKDGYGRIRMRNMRSKFVTASRISWMAYRGPIPDGMHVLHKCDVRSCVNPDHLFLGTHQDNHADMIAKGRGHNTKLAVAQVRAIRADSRSQTAIALGFGISQSLVSSIKARKTWSHVT